jgi:chalcone isomerase-like protein
VLEFWRAASLIEQGRRAAEAELPAIRANTSRALHGERMSRVALAMLVVVPVAVAPVRAASLAGVDLPDTVTVDGVTLLLNGMGLREATFLRVKAYVGGLYLEQRTSDADTVIASRQLKRVTMKFLRDIDRGPLASGWADELRKVTPKPPEDRITQFTALIPDVKKGDTMSFTWRPAVGIEVARNGEVRGSVSGDEFARALFTVWFGPHPGDENLKRGMLGK